MSTQISLITKFAFVVMLTMISSIALARPGFYIGAGYGHTSVNGETIPYSDMTFNELVVGGTQWGNATTQIDGGQSIQLRMGYNIKGYAAIETMLTGAGNDLGDTALISWAAHWQTGVRVYPMWHWQNKIPTYLRALEPSLFLGVGISGQAYNPSYDNAVGWRDYGSWRSGIGLEYFVVPFFKLGLDYNYVRANYSEYIYSDRIDAIVDPPARTTFHQVYLTGTFHFQPATHN